MKIEFKKFSRVTRFLDPSTGFQENERPTEIRVDPLTGQTSRVLYFPIRMLSKPDLTDVVNRSLEFGCPFCPQMLEMVTPKFPPDITEKERIRKGDAVVFPNMFPYDTYSAVAIFSEEHFKPLGDFSPELMRDGFCVSQEFLAASLNSQKQSRLYTSINWNYMPLAGGSIIHPHLQIIAGESGTNYHQAVLKASSEYARQNGGSYWLDLLEQESLVGERFLGKIGPVGWLTSFSPKGFIDFMAVFERAGSITDITESEWLDFARGLSAAMKFLDSRGFYSFNMAVYSGFGGEHFRTFAKLIPRALLPPMNTSDINYFNTLHNEVLTIFKPEDICSEARGFFHDVR